MRAWCKRRDSFASCNLKERRLRLTEILRFPTPGTGLQELLRADTVDVLVGPEAVGGGENVAGGDETAATVGGHRAIYYEVNN